MKFWIRTMLLLLALPSVGCDREKQPMTVAETGKPEIELISGDATDLLCGKHPGRKFALLVGVTKYDTLKVNQLIGPVNDVQAMGQMLKNRYGFADKDIVILADCAGATGRPTRANIKSHFDRLAKEARAGDQMVVLLAGHGDQQPDQEPFDEPDGLDQIFLPCDADKWDANKKTVVNAIIDDEMDVWTKAIAKGGASLWLIVDACHSGTMLRSGSDEVARDLPEGTLVPSEAMSQARKGAVARKDTARGEEKKPIAKAENDTPRLMALYACQRDQTAPELTAPSGGKTRHGLLSYTIVQVLSEAKTKLTYRELTQRIQAKYSGEWFRNSPIPLMEGLDQDTEVLGEQSWAGRSQFILDKSDEGWKIQAGQLHGLSENSILAVYPPAGSADADKIVGHVRICKCLPAESEVEPCAYGKTPIPKELSKGGRCELAYRDYGAMRLRVGIEGAGKGEGEGHRRARKLLMEIAKASDSLIELAEPGEQADMMIRLKAEKLFLLASDVALSPGEPPPGSVSFGPFYADQAQKLQTVLTKVARARNLLKVIERGSSDGAGDLEVEMLKFKDSKDTKGSKILAGPKGLVLQPGELVGWRITNSGRSRVTLDVSLLFINSQYGIHSVFPKKGEGGSGVNRFKPEQSYLLGPIPVTAKTVGTEHMIVIAVKAEGQPIDFTCLAQPTIDSAREVTRGKDTLETPLGRLFKGAMFGQGTARGLGDMVEPDSQAFRLMSWTVPPHVANK